MWIRGIALAFLLGGHAIAVEPPASARPRSTAELERALAASNEPAARLDLLLQLARPGDARTAAQTYASATEALALARELKDGPKELQAHLRLGAALRRRNLYTDALRVIDQGLALATGSTHLRVRAELLNLRGATLWNMAKLADAVESHFEALRIAEQLGDKRLLASTHNGLGVVYTDFKNPEKTREHYDAALALIEELGDRDQLASILNNFGNYHLRQKSYARARELHERVLGMRREMKDRTGISDSLVNLGAIAEAEGDLAAALALYEEALALRQQVGLERRIAAAHHLVGNALRQLDRTDEALAHLRTGLPMAQKIGSHEVLANFYGALALTHEARGEFAAALDFQRKLEKEGDAMVGERSRQRLAELETRYGTEKKQHEIELLQRREEVRQAQLRAREAELRIAEEQLERQKFQRNALLAGVFLGAVALMALVSRQRHKAQAERRILERTRLAKEEAERASAWKSHLLSIASHDLKTPLAALITSAQSIEQDARGNPAIRELAAWMQQEGRRLFSLIQDLLDTAALEVGKLELHRSPLDLGELAFAMLADFRVCAAQKQQSIAFESDDRGSCLVEGDATRLRQVIENLVSNAIKYSPLGKTITITVRRGDQVKLSVRDEGPGLTRDELGEVFQRFRRLSARPTAGETSTGLGLSIAHELVTLHGGKLSVQSEAGHGATFTAEFPPLAAEAATGESVSPLSSQEISSRSLAI